MADKEITIKVSTTADTQEVDDLKTQLEAMENTNVKLEFDADKTPIDEAKESTEDLQSAFEDATNTVDELTQELADIEMGVSDADFDTVNEALTEATERADELGSALADLDSSRLQEASDNAQSLGDSTQQATSDVEQLSDSMGLIESTMLMDMANQIGALGDQAEGMAQEMNTASISVGHLATNSGIAESQMVGLINNISNATFPQEEAIQYVNVLNQMGVSADKLGDSATNMDRINDATGMGSDKVMLLTQGLQSLGVTADNLPSSFNAIAYAEANVGGGAETLQQVLRRQAGTLNEYGMGVDATVVALSALQRETGLTGMKLGSEFRSRLKDCNGDLSALEQSLGLQAGALSNASSETDKYTGKLQQLANEEAEHKTFLDQVSAGWEDVQLALSPVLNPLMQVVSVIGSLGQTALAINSLLTLAETFGILKTATIAQSVSNIWLAFTEWLVASPILILVAVILILIGILVYLYYTNEDVRNAVDGLGQAFVEAGQVIYGAVLGFVDWVIQQLQNLWMYITTLGGLLDSSLKVTGNSIIDGVLAVIIFISTLPAQIGIIFLNVIAKVLGFGDNFVQNMIEAGVNAVNNFIQWIKQIPQKLGEQLDNALNKVQEWASTLPQKFWEAGVNAVKNFLNALDMHSPGTMQRMLIWEITEMGKRVPDESRNLIRNIGDMGEEMVDAYGTPQFNTPTFQYSKPEFANDTLSDLTAILSNQNMNGDIIINHYGDVDNDERQRKMVDAIRRELHWNNKTSGRTV